MPIKEGVVWLLIFGAFLNAQDAKKQDRQTTTRQGGDLPSMIENVRASVVRVRAIFDDGPGYGSGFLADVNGTIITAAHVVSRGKPPTRIDAHVILVGARLAGTTGIDPSNFFSSEARILYEDTEHDIAVLKMADRAPSSMRAAVVATVRPLEGEAVFICGYPFGSKNIFTTAGIVATSFRPLFDPPEGLQSDLYILDIKNYEGMSGGPAFVLSTGEIIGILTGNQPEGAKLLDAPNTQAFGAAQGNPHDLHPLAYPTALAEIAPSPHVTAAIIRGRNPPVK